MSLYAIGDLHLSFGSEKPMDVFGGKWEGYVEKITEGFKKVKPDDIVVLCGDSSWGMSLEESSQDFGFISELPGNKILLKGNHDYWWSTVSKMEANFVKLGISNIQVLHNNCFFYEDIAVCGTRGWFYEEEYADSNNEKVYKRELGRLRASLSAGKKAGANRLFAFLHYPPLSYEYKCEEILELFELFDVELCCYGHLHGNSHKRAFEGPFNGVEYKLVSADFLDFSPLKLI